jgi:hypothetical protein
MANLILNGSTSGSVTLSSPAVSGTTTLTLPTTTSTLAINGPAFSAFAGSATTIPNNVTTKVLFNTEEYDTNNNFASSTFTPTIAGYYQMTFNVKASVTTTLSRFIVSVYKNGITTGRQWDCDVDSGAAWFVNGSRLLYCNGTTDAITLYVYIEGTGTITIGSNDLNTNYFSGVLVKAA